MQPTDKGIFNMIKLLTITLFIFTSTLSNAFRYVKHESFVDPDYQNYKAKNILLVVKGRSNEMQIETERYLKKYFAKTRVKITALRNIFPPTRKWTNEEMYQILLNRKVDSILTVTEGNRSKKTTQYATRTNSNTNIQGTTYGNSFNANANTTSTTTNITHSKSIAEFTATLSDLKNGKTVWLSNINISAGGNFFTTNKGDAKGVSKRIIKVLLEDGIINKK